MAITLAPVGGPASWRGPELVASSAWKVAFTPAHLDELASAAQHAEIGDLDADRCRAIRAAMPTLVPVLAEARRELVDGRGFVLLRGFPVDQYDDDTIERMYWCLGLALGIPVPQTRDGLLLDYVRDLGLDINDPHVRGYQTRSKLEYHVDGSDVVGLLCVRAAREGGISTLVSSTAIHDEMVARRPDLAALLYDDYWFDRRSGDGPDSFYAMPIFDRQGGRLATYYGRTYIESAQRGPQTGTLTPEQREAIELVDTLANSSEFVLPMDLQPGDVQFLNNWLVMHSRTDYADWPESERKRLMIRFWLSLGDGRPAEMVP